MTFEAHYQQALSERGFQPDPAQLRAVAALARVGRELRAATPRGWFAKRFTRPEPVRGLYLWGGVGRGKTFLMDLFVNHLQLERSHRSHFHRFMKELHDELKARPHAEDPLAGVADELAGRYRLLCFDEFFVSDIADAMLLGRLFGQLFANGVTLVATSNVPPADLYRDGLQRTRFEPAIELLQHHCEVLNVDGDTDYRLRALGRRPLYVTPNGAEADTALARHFERVAPGAGETGRVLTIESRPLKTRRCAHGVAWFDFDELCGGPRSQNDYIELARRYQTVLVADVPRFDETLEDKARRFIALVDEFYDRRVRLIVSAAAPPQALYAGSRLGFEFERTASRLIEMQTTDYLSQPHLA
ncbi:MAG: cell division protein ZapE [Pseudomonadota bacterium]